MTNTQFKLIENGRVKQGLHSQPVDEINFRDFHLRTAMGKTAGAFKRWFGFNQFQFVSAICPELIVGAAIVDTRIAVVSFVYIYHTASGKLHSYQFKAPTFGGFSSVNQTPDNGTWYFRQGQNSVELSCANNERTLTVRLKDGTSVDMTFPMEEFDPIRLATRVDINGFAYTQKMAGVPCKGQVSCKSGTFDLEELKACASLDWSAGYLRRRCFWNWICLSGQMDDGRAIGVNGACFTNESSFNENGFWVDGKLYILPGIAFDYDPDKLFEPWSIYSNNQHSNNTVEGQHPGGNKLNLTFYPEGAQVEKNNFMIMASNFHQLFGHFEGELTTADGEVITIDKIYGFTEEHYAKW
ncbi:DUF2804 domain-containing protein [Parendozoicomonas haliclonae]|uniref:DUF2804 domain-containing protein n=1 Tax=Parendozoicomonas haliclonae TaxID=1960125 RepID=A0A1X7AG27_9GAMM|nr:DUF2804 domain-containing protein [Parendozoicomonas haliclonae]SMA38151.1 hypothetical protein EHSB41UT_00841 [Parendozoicomonas haliclonae]